MGDSAGDTTPFGLAHNWCPAANLSFGAYDSKSGPFAGGEGWGEGDLTRVCACTAEASMSMHPPPVRSDLGTWVPANPGSGDQGASFPFTALTTYHILQTRPTPLSRILSIYTNSPSPQWHWPTLNSPLPPRTRYFDKLLVQPIHITRSDDVVSPKQFNNI